MGLPEVPALRHVCVSPKWLNFPGDRAKEERLTISNVGTGPVTITGVAMLSDRALTGFSIDSQECNNRTLHPGEHCKVAVSLRKRIGETMKLTILNDLNEPESVTVTATEKAMR
jgi:hypothetical protein